MRGRTGLGTEIIVNIVLLMGAALLFTGFLLIRLTERELLAQRVAGATGTMEILARTASEALFSEDSGTGNNQRGATLLFEGVPAGSGVQGWAVVGGGLEILGVGGRTPGFHPAEEMLSRAKLTGEPEYRISYGMAWPLFGSPPDSHVVVTVPVLRQGIFLGALQARFSLAEVRQRILAAQKLMLLYAVLYGGVLVFFGIYFLNRIVVGPVSRLQKMSQLIAAGDLNQTVPVEGPREIAELAGSFNSMAASLRQSREETEAHIRDLQRANAELRQTQSELILSEKMASVGHLAAGMAHEIGNPLGAVVGYLGFLKGETPEECQKEIIDRALVEAGRIDRLVRELLDYAAPAGGEKQTFDPVTAMTEARDILRNQGAFDGFELEDRLPPALPDVCMLRHQLVQVFVNLLLNARDASAKAGAIRIFAGEKVDSVWLAVSDSGSGMSPEIVAHIFDPFYTTKAPGKGRGLGLAVCQRVIGQAGGRIEIRSAPGEGSKFTVWLQKAETGRDDG